MHWPNEKLHTGLKSLVGKKEGNTWNLNKFSAE
jgi:hypothetical protein